MADRLFVGREGELARLEYFLGQALGGRGQTAFVTGEAGSGKTALIEAFAEKAGRYSDDLIVALGNCSAHSGMADPYLPFCEVLSILSGVGASQQHFEYPCQPTGKNRGSHYPGLG